MTTITRFSNCQGEKISTSSSSLSSYPRGPSPPRWRTGTSGATRVQNQPHYRARRSHSSSYLPRNVRPASRNPNLLYRAMAGFCGVVVLRTSVRNPWTRHQSIAAWVNRVPTPRRHTSSATRSRLSSATSFRRRYSRHSWRSGGISANVVGPMTCTVPTIRSSLSEGTAATQLAETSCITSSGAEVFSAFHLLSPASLACFALSYIASTSASSPGRYGRPSREPLPQARRLVASHGFVRELTLPILVVTTGAHSNGASLRAGAITY